MREAKKQPDAKRKRRTLDHIHADLSMHYIEGLVLRCGFSLERQYTDYGYDVRITTYNDKGEIENGIIHAQLGEAYWIDVRWLAQHDPPTIKKGTNTVNLHIPRANILGAQTFILLQSVKQDLQRVYQDAAKSARYRS